MEKTGTKKMTIRVVVAVVIAVLMLGYIGAMTMPFVTYTKLDDKKLSAVNAELEKGKKIKADWTWENDKFILSPVEYAANDETVSLMQYLWTPYKCSDLTRDVLPNVFVDAGIAKKYSTTSTIGFPLFSFIIGIVGAFIIGFFGKKNWSVLFPIVWSIGTLLGYFVFPILGFMNKTSYMVHIVISALVLVLSIVFFFLFALPSIRYNIAHKEKY